MFDITPPITADDVLDAVEDGLNGTRFWIFPGPYTAIFIRLRRWFPGLMWWAVHRTDGR